MSKYKKSKNKSNKNSRITRSKNWMLAQYLNPKYFDWTNNNTYSDKAIKARASKFSGATSPYYNIKSRFHYIYECYQHYYFKYTNEYQHSFTDYKFMFKGKPREVADKVALHVAMRLCFYYFVDTYENAKKYSRKGTTPKMPKPPKLAWITHYADKSQNGDIVKTHFHFALKFPKPVTPTQLSKWTGIEPQYFESTYKGRYAYENELAYLIHAKQPQKHSYDPKAVHANFDYMKVYNNHREAWKLRASIVKMQLQQKGIGWLEDQVRNNPRMTYRHILLNDKLYNIMTSKPKYINEISNLFNARADRIAAQTEALIKDKRLNLSVIYIWGNSGVGKTTEADRIINNVKSKHPDWSVYKTAQSSQTGSAHPFDDYSGEPIVFFDEARNTDLSAEAWLSLLDALHTNTLSARYHNKHIASRVIIMTTTENPIDFFGFMQGIHTDEPLSQFLRRLGLILHVVIKVENGHRAIAYRYIRQLPYSITVPVGSGSNETSKTTKYAPMPASASLHTVSEATSKAMSYIDRNTNTKVKHHVGARKLVSSSAASSYVSEARQVRLSSSASASAKASAYSSASSKSSLSSREASFNSELAKNNGHLPF